MFLRIVDLATFFWTILALDFYGPHTDFCPDLSWMPAYLHIKCGKLTTGHPWNLLRIVHGSWPFVWMTSSIFGSPLLWHPLRSLPYPLLPLSQQLLNVVFPSITLSDSSTGSSFPQIGTPLYALLHPKHPTWTVPLITVYIFISF